MVVLPTRTAIVDRAAVLQLLLEVFEIFKEVVDCPRTREQYPSFQTCHRCFQQWVRSAGYDEDHGHTCRKLGAKGALDVREAFIDASFPLTKKGASDGHKNKKVVQPWR
jgi:hypothetical protein